MAHVGLIIDSISGASYGLLAVADGYNARVAVIPDRSRVEVPYEADVPDGYRRAPQYAPDFNGDTPVRTVGWDELDRLGPAALPLERIEC